MRTVSFCRRHIVRPFSTRLHVDRRNQAAEWTSQNVRKSFLDYFCKQHDHSYVRSSSVVPRADPTLAFVNAGMNQFKEVLLGRATPPGGARRAANSQKCIRVGGKHNDLEEVGTDGTHHTFFEMLGSWSFGDYFKRDACRLAWELLTGVYGVPEDHLHVTYFAGDDRLGIPADAETYHIWREMGLPEERVLGCGLRDNFWEMGVTGPCGPCTEIHYNQPGGTQTQKLTELWNIVFIQYNREADGGLRPLPKHHVDTGMGYERLVAVLQGHNSNYDTDLFTPLMAAIQGRSKCPAYGTGDGSLDVAYRVVSDHARMATVALADGCLPHVQAKLRAVLRRAFQVSHKVFAVDQGLVSELAPLVADSLGDVYPEVHANLPRVQHIMEAEEELLFRLRDSACKQWHSLAQKHPQLNQMDVTEAPGLVDGVRYLESVVFQPGLDHMPTEVAWKLNETYGVPTAYVQTLANLFGLSFDVANLKQYWETLKTQQKEEWRVPTQQQAAAFTLDDNAVTHLRQFPPTDDASKYNYGVKEGRICFPKTRASVQAVLVGGMLRTEITRQDIADAPDVGLVLDRTCLYTEAGGQHADTGQVTIEGDVVFHVDKAVRLPQAPGCIVHVGQFADVEQPWTVRVHDRCVVALREDTRLDTMRNHTATHLLQAALGQVLTVVSQQSSRVTDKELVFDMAVYKQNLGLPDIERLEWLVQKVIASKVPVTRRLVQGDELSRMPYVTLVPGEVYPVTGVSIVQVDAGYLLSREPCCGTHVPNTSFLEDFVVTSYNSNSSNVKSVRAVTGKAAVQARQDMALILESFRQVENKVELMESLRTSNSLPYVPKIRLIERLKDILRSHKSNAKGIIKKEIKVAVAAALSTLDRRYLVLCIPVSGKAAIAPLYIATEQCPHLPHLLIAQYEGLIKCYCYIPESTSVVSLKWMQVVADIVGGKSTNLSNGRVAVLNSRRVPQDQLELALVKAKDFADSYFS